jgi:Zn-finger nucleic acid-binding protein
MDCPRCGAPLSAGRAKCAYCGMTADVDFAGRSIHTTRPPEHPRICASCDKPMESLDIGTADAPFFIDRCAGCMGLFLDTGELDAIINREVPPVYEVDHLALARLAEQNGEVVRYRKCPVCRKLMNRVNYGGSSGVIEDRCREHGIYLDAGELKRILAWVRAGGRLEAAQKSAEENARISREVKLPAIAELGLEEDSDLTFPRLGALLLKWFRDRSD